MNSTEREVAKLVEEYFELVEQYSEYKQMLAELEQRMSLLMDRLYRNCSLEDAHKSFEFLERKAREEREKARRASYLYLAMSIRDWLDTAHERR